MSSVTIVGFLITIVALVVFLGVTFFQVSRVRGIEPNADSDDRS